MACPICKMEEESVCHDAVWCYPAVSDVWVGLISKSSTEVVVQRDEFLQPME